MKTLRYSTVNTEFSHLIMVDKIVRLSKSNDGETTYIHLINGEILTSSDSINILEARLKSE